MNAGGTGMRNLGPKDGYGRGIAIGTAEFTHAIVYSVDGGLAGAGRKADRFILAINNHDAIVAALCDLLDDPTSTEVQVRAAKVLAEAEGGP